MTYKIEVQPAGVQYKSENNLLNDALEQSISLEHSCKTGECGACSAEIISGTVSNENGEIVTAGTILTCQSKALSDVVLKANHYPELADIQVQTVPCKVALFSYPVEDTLIINFRLPPTAKFNYLPGQYLDLSFKGIKRSYSIANAQSISEGIELHIRHVPSGKMSAALFSGLKTNQLMRVEGPKGTFFVRDDIKPLIFLAGGTGFAPVKAMVEALIEAQDTRQIYIYWGMPSESSLYSDVAERWCHAYSHINYIPVVSGDAPGWLGRTGFVHQAVVDDFNSLDKFQVYACGSALMINAAKVAFEIKGLPSGQFFSDAFTPAK